MGRSAALDVVAKGKTLLPRGIELQNIASHFADSAQLPQLIMHSSVWIGNTLLMIRVQSVEAVRGSMAPQVGSSKDDYAKFQIHSTQSSFPTVNTVNKTHQHFATKLTRELKFCLHWSLEHLYV